MKALDDSFGGDADGGDEEFGARVNYYGYELVEFAFCVVIAITLITGVSDNKEARDAVRQNLCK